MQTLQEAIIKHGITMQAPRGVSHNPTMEDQIKDGFHWDITLERGSEKLSFFMSTGSGWVEKYQASSGETKTRVKKPRCADALSCSICDAGCLDQDFEDFCGELGYDPDSKKAERIYEACKESKNKLLEFLSDEILEDLLYNTEGY